MLDIDADAEIAEIGRYLDTLEGSERTYAPRVCAFAVEQLLDDDSPISLKVTSAYLKWALFKPNLAARGELLFDCVCNDGWKEHSDGSVRPCEKCQPLAFSSWFDRFADQKEPPHGGY